MICGLLGTRSSLSPSWSIAWEADSDCVAWLMRRNESLESKEPERLRLWPLFALPDRVRLGGLSTANSALLLWPSSIGASGNRELGHQLAGIQSPNMGKSGPDTKSLCSGLLLLTSRAEMEFGFGDQQEVAFPPGISGTTES